MPEYAAARDLTALEIPLERDTFLREPIRVLAGERPRHEGRRRPKPAKGIHRCKE